MALVFNKKTIRSNAEERYYLATQWQLMIRKFKRHKLAIVGMIALTLLYLVAVFCEFFAVYDVSERNTKYIHVPPQRLRFVSEEGFSIRPFVYALKMEEDPVTWRKNYVEDTSQKHYIRFFIQGAPYRMWGIFPGELRLFGVEEGGTLFLFGTDQSGRDLYSRIIYGLRVSLFVGLVGVAFTFVLGCVLGGISGYYGGKLDIFIQRLIEFLMSIPSIPLWMSLAAAMPQDWPVVRMYFAITIILSLVGWCGLARVVRGKFLQLREADFVMAAKLFGASDSYIIRKHLLPGFLSYLIVSLTLAIPAMILGETSLSFLGIGLRPPAISLGVLLRDAQNLKAIALHPWLMIPGIFIIVIVLAFNFMGDGMRDAADPYK